MNKDQIREELKRHEEACAELRAKLDAPESPDPAPLDVRINGLGEEVLLGTADGIGLWCGRSDYVGADQWTTDMDTYLGKFNEVYVKVDDVIAALSHGDCHGDTILRSRTGMLAVGASAFEKSRTALAKLSPKFAEAMK